MRDCPTVEGTSVPLIIHRVTAAACSTRQSCNYHKCHQCIYRGQAADWEPKVLPQAAGERVITPQRGGPDKPVVRPRVPAAEQRSMNGSPKQPMTLESSSA